MNGNNVFQTGEIVETIMEVDSIDDDDCIMNDTVILNYPSQYPLDVESLMVIEEYDASSSCDTDCVGNVSSSETISIGFSEHENTVSGTIELSNQRVTTEYCIMSENDLLSVSNDDDSSNSGYNAISKTDTPSIVLNSPLISNQIEKTSFTVPTTSVVNPKIATAWFHSNSNITKINKLFSKQDLIATPSNESNSGIYMIPHDGMSCITREKIKHNSELLINSSANEHKFGEFVGIEKYSENSCQFENTRDSRHMQFKRTGSPAKSLPNKISKSDDLIVVS